MQRLWERKYYSECTAHWCKNNPLGFNHSFKSSSDSNASTLAWQFWLFCLLLCLWILELPTDLSVTSHIYLSALTPGSWDLHTPNVTVFLLQVGKHGNINEMCFRLCFRNDCWVSLSTPPYKWTPAATLFTVLWFSLVADMSTVKARNPQKSHSVDCGDVADWVRGCDQFTQTVTRPLCKMWSSKYSSDYVLDSRKSLSSLISL